MGVFCVDRTGALVFGAPNVLWALVGDVLGALGAPHADAARTRDGFVPSWLARAWGDVVFTDLGDVVVVARPIAARGPALRPVGVYRSGSPGSSAWSRAGEHVSVYDTPLATPLLGFAQACTVSAGYTVTTLRPPAPGDVPSSVAARRLLERSGLLRRAGAAARSPSRPAVRVPSRTDPPGARALRTPAPPTRSNRT